MKGTPTEPGRNSPYRDRSVAENLRLFEDMRNGKFKDGEKTLRAKIDMASPNMHLRDPLMYRIRHAHHHRTGDKWCIYPMYDFAHGQCDSIEEITHSVCTLEFEVHRPLYEWFLEQLDVFKPRQIEFNRLNLNYTVMSKRKLRRLVEENHVNGWDDPRMPTLRGMRRRGYTAEAILDFVQRMGISTVATSNSGVIADMAFLESCVKRINKLDADMIVMTGDFMQWTSDFAAELAGLLSKMKSRLGTFAVLGNHDYGVCHPGKPATDPVDHEEVIAAFAVAHRDWWPSVLPGLGPDQPPVP